MPSAVSIGVIIAVLENSPYFRYTIRKRGDRMFLQYYVTDSTTRNRVNIEINAATKADLDATRNGWQTVWNTDFILDPQKEK